MKRVLLICAAALIFAALTSPIRGFILSVAEGQETIPPEENAATYYNKAFALMKDWPSKDAKTGALKIIEQGWKEEDKELEKFLKANRGAFEEFRKGVAKEKCQFIEEEITFDTLLPHLSKARNLARLLILEARLFERNGDLEKALQNCLDAIKLGHDLGEDRILISKLVDFALFYIAEDALLSLVRNDKLTRQLARDTLKGIRQLEAKVVPAREALLGEMRCANSSLRKLLREIRQGAETGSRREPMSEEVKFMKQVMAPIAGDKELSERLLKEYDQLAKQYFGTIISYMEQGKYNEILPFAENFYGEIYIESRRYTQAVLSGSEKRPEIITKILGAMLLPAVARFPNEVGKTGARTRAIMAILAVRLFKMEKGRYPNKLDELVPEYLENVPLDPFDLKPLRYKKRQGKWIIYSIGPDGKDDGGMKNYVHREPEEGADLIFEVEAVK